MTEPLVPIERENSPPILLSETPGFGVVTPIPIDPVTKQASMTFSIDVLDSNNPEDLSVSWFADYQGAEIPPCGSGQLLRVAHMIRPGATADSRSDSATFTTPALGCHKVEAIVCDGLADQENPCQARGCAEGAFELSSLFWFVCVHDGPVGECVIPGGGCL